MNGRLRADSRHVVAVLKGPPKHKVSWYVYFETENRLGTTLSGEKRARKEVCVQHTGERIGGVRSTGGRSDWALGEQLPRRTRSTGASSRKSRTIII